MKTVKVDKSLSKNYFQYEKTILFDKSLSSKAKGIHALLMALGDNWQFSMSGLITMCKESRDSVYAGIAELESKKYVRREKLNSGHVNYTFYEIPYDKYLHYPHTENTDKPNTENPDMGKPDTENPTLLRDNNSINIDNSIKRNVEVQNPIFSDEIKTKEFLQSQKITIEKLAMRYNLSIDLVNVKIHEFVEKKLSWDENTWSSEGDLKKNFDLWLNLNRTVIVNPYKSMTETVFKADCAKHEKEFGKKTLTDFFRYWKQPTETGVMRFQEKNAWNTEDQLKIWRSRNNDKEDISLSKAKRR